MVTRVIRVIGSALCLKNAGMPDDGEIHNAGGIEVMHGTTETADNELFQPSRLPIDWLGAPEELAALFDALHEDGVIAFRHQDEIAAHLAANFTIKGKTFRSASIRKIRKDEDSDYSEERKKYLLPLLNRLRERLLSS